MPSFFFHTAEMSNIQPGTQPVRKGKRPANLIVDAADAVQHRVGPKSNNKRADVDKRRPGVKHAGHRLEQQVVEHHNTSIYLRGRDVVYPDAQALARFNNWVTANQATISPSDQFVCTKCGHVDFTLCAHSIAPDVEPVVPAAAEIVPRNLRHHEWSFRPVKAIRDALQWPKFDTHSQSDSALHGFSNHHLTDELMVPELFSYLAFNMQTSYKVNGAEDRALRLAHVHRLAQKWVITKGLEKTLEADQHYSVRVRFTVQRACDNAQNAMLYGERDPSRNFGLAWLPGSRVSQLMSVFLVVLALYHFSTTLGLLMRAWEVAYMTGSATLYILKCVAVSVPDLGLKMFVSASKHQSGNGLRFQCVSTDYETRWYAPPGDAHTVTQSCDFMEWVMAGLTEVSSQSSDTYKHLWEGTNRSWDETCDKLWLEYAGYQTIWAGEKLMKYLEMGMLGPTDVLRLWFWTTFTQIRLYLFRC